MPSSMVGGHGWLRLVVPGRDGLRCGQTGVYWENRHSLNAERMLVEYTLNLRQMAHHRHHLLRSVGFGSRRRRGACANKMA